MLINLILLQWLLKTHLLPGCKHKEQKILYQLIRADFIRYKCEAAHKKLKQGNLNI